MRRFTSIPKFIWMVSQVFFKEPRSWCMQIQSHSRITKNKYLTQTVKTVLQNHSCTVVNVGTSIIIVNGTEQGF